LNFSPGLHAAKKLGGGGCSRDEMRTPKRIVRALLRISKEGSAELVSIFPQALLLPLHPEVAGAAEGLVDAGGDARTVHLALQAAGSCQLLLRVCPAAAFLPAADQVRAVVAAAVACKQLGNQIVSWAKK